MESLIILAVIIIFCFVFYRLLKTKEADNSTSASSPEHARQALDAAFNLVEPAPTPVATKEPETPPHLVPVGKWRPGQTWPPFEYDFTPAESGLTWTYHSEEIQEIIENYNALLKQRQEISRWKKLIDVWKSEKVKVIECQLSEEAIKSFHLAFRDELFHFRRQMTLKLFSVDDIEKIFTVAAKDFAIINHPNVMGIYHLNLPEARVIEKFINNPTHYNGGMTVEAWERLNPSPDIPDCDLYVRYNDLFNHLDPPESWRFNKLGKPVPSFIYSAAAIRFNRKGDPPGRFSLRAGGQEFPLSFRDLPG